MQRIQDLPERTVLSTDIQLKSEIKINASVCLKEAQSPQKSKNFSYAVTSTSDITAPSSRIYFCNSLIKKSSIV